MELVNGTQMIADYAPGMNPEGRELLVVVVKGTFTIPQPGQPAKLAAEQAPLVAADVFTGKPGFFAPVYECDYPPHKPQCDVILNGSAYAPGGAPADSVAVALRVGPIDKSLNVVGNRFWKFGLLGLSVTAPEPFIKMPISYDNAFGGVDNLLADETKHRTYLKNHAGRGFYDKSPSSLLHGKPLPNTEEIGRKISKSNGNYNPMAYGPIGRAWGDRPKLAGTYDQNWQDNVFPFLPADFDDAYNQSTPPDQQMPYLVGGEQVELVNLTPEGTTTFAIPQIDVPIEFNIRDEEDEPRMEQGIADTLIIEPDLGRFIICWRAVLPLKKNLVEVNQVVVGKMSPAWYRARDQGKEYFVSLKELVDGSDE